MTILETATRRELLGLASGMLVTAQPGWRTALQVAPARGGGYRAVYDDVFVLVPGIMGSTLYLNKRAVWAPTPSSVVSALVTGGESLLKLKLTDDSPEIDKLDDGVTAEGLVPDLHIIPG